MEDHLAKNYFELFQLSVRFNLDKAVLKKKYYALSRQTHPDVLIKIGDSDSMFLELSGKVNQGYTTLNDDVLRTEYICGLYLDSSQREHMTLDPNFLMDMMEINEELEVVESEKKMEDIQQLQAKIQIIENEVNDSLNGLQNVFDNGQNDIQIIKQIYQNYLKLKYLLRIRENMSTFAS